MAQKRCDVRPEIKQLINRAASAYRRGDYPATLHVCRQILDINPVSADALHLRAVALLASGSSAAALHTIEQAIAIDAANPVFYNALGVILTQRQAFVPALQAHDKALRFAPDYADAGSNKGLVLIRLGQYAAAIHQLKKVARAHPDHAAAQANLALAHRFAGDFPTAVDCYEKALSLNPSHQKWRFNTGALYLEMGAYQKAIACFECLRSAGTHTPVVLNALGIAYRAQGLLEQSILCFETLIRQYGHDPEAIANLAVVYRYVCAWEKTADMDQRVEACTSRAIAQGQTPKEQPLLNIMRVNDPERNLVVARLHSRALSDRRRDKEPAFSHSVTTASEARITIGYLSGDFRNHPVAHQMAGLYRLHDRKGFRVLCFSTGMDDGSSFRRDIAGTCDHFFDLCGKGPGLVAETIYNQKVDILVDLTGHTHGNQLMVCAARPAPVQVSYLGFLGSTGSDFIDYIIADKTVAPESHALFYSEKMVWMPWCYQVTDNRHDADESDVNRRDHHLPENGFVFCCFNQSYKIDAAVFTVWMRILTQVPDAVLWLFRANPTAVRNMRQGAAAAGIDPRRIVFADKLPLHRHLTRLQTADLGLDTFSYNGGATTANALWAGVPVIAMLGNHFVSRMAASHLKAAGLADLITHCARAYEALAVELARSPDRLSRIRETLRNARITSPLFDTRQFVRDLEHAYTLMWKRYRAGKTPDHITLRPSPYRALES